MLRYLEHTEIDPEKWNSLVERSADSTVYSYSWYLDTLCNWNAIILNDYEGAIPLPTRTRLGITQLYQPPFIQHCSWFGAACNTSELSALLKERYSDIRFNSYTPLDLPYDERVNLELVLDRDAEELQASFKKDLRKNLRKYDGSVLIEQSSDPTHCIKLYKDAYGTLSGLTDGDYQNFSDLFNTAAASGHSLCYNAIMNDHVIASMCFMKANNRLHYVLGAPNEKGKNVNALSQVFWYLIKRNADSGLIIDFEGSSIESVARFYKSFGSSSRNFREYYDSKGMVKLARKFLK